MLIPCIVIATNLVTVARLISYERGRSSYRPGVSFVAYLLIVCAGGQVIDTVLNGATSSVWQAGFSVCIMVLALRARGNVAQIVRTI